MSKKKVLFITPSLCQGGREQSLITMFKMINKNEYDVTLYVYQDDLSLLPLVPNWIKVVSDTQKPHYFRKPIAVLYMMLGFFTKNLKLKKLNDRISVNFKAYIHNQKVIHPSKNIFKKEKYDVVVSYATGFCSEIAVHIKANKRILFFHNSVDLHHDLLSKTLILFDRLVAVSDGVKKMLCDNYKNIDNKIIVIQNYVDAESVIKKSSEIIDIDCKKLTLCTCGRLSKEKGFNLAIESAKLLKQKGVDFIWYFVGDGEQRECLESLIYDYSLNENIVITGFKDNPFPYMRLCNIYIQPSYQESFGLTIKEALIIGKSVVSTDTVGGRTVLEDGRYGLIVPVAADGIFEGIYSIYKNKVNNEKYSIDNNAMERCNYIQQINSLLND